MSDAYSFGGFGDYTPGFGGGPAPIADNFGVSDYNPLGGSDLGYLGGPMVPLDVTGFGSGPSGGFDPSGGFSPDLTGFGGSNIPGYGYGGALPGYEAPIANFSGGTGYSAMAQAPGADSPVASLMAPQALAAPGGPMAGGASDAGGTSEERIRQQIGGQPQGQPQKQGSILDSLGIKNPAQTLLGAAGLAYNIARGQGDGVGGIAMTPQMMAQANSLNATGKQLMGYLQSGTLPPGLKASLDQATQAAKAKVIQNFASQGMPTDPDMNSALAQQLAQIDQQAIITTAQIGQQLLDSGAKATGLSSDVYKTLASIDQTQSANMSRAIANFAAALNGGQPQQVRRV